MCVGVVWLCLVLCVCVGGVCWFGAARLCWCCVFVLVLFVGVGVVCLVWCCVFVLVLCVGVGVVCLVGVV